MYKYIKTSSDGSEATTIHIEIDVYMNCGYKITAADDPDKVLPVLRSDGTVDRTALSRWETFVKNVSLKFAPLFKTMNIDRSPVEMSLTSRYFWVYARNADGSVNVEIILRLRLSDHDYTEDHDVGGEVSFVNDEAHNYSRTDKFGTQFVEVSEILIKSKELGINNSYDTYAQALKAVYEQALRIKHDFLDLQYMHGGEPHDDWGEDYQYEPIEHTDEEIRIFEESYKKRHGKK